MNELQVDARAAQLKNKKICRFCLSQNDELTNMYSRENRIKSSAPLPLQVMACVSIEVFTNDGMPSTICDNCRIVMEHCYRFKQMCKKADNALRQFPLTGTWPSKFELPKIPEELLRKQYPELYAQRSSIESTSDNEQEEQSHIDIAISKTQEIKTESYAIDPRTTSVKVIRPIKPDSPSVAPLQRPSPGRPKLLNKNSNKILNKNAIVTSEPMLSEPKIKRDNAGNMEIVTEIIESKYEEPDPIKNAAKVETNVFPCEHCERSFPLRQLLDIHMVNHIRQRSFQCEHCDKKFFSKYDLGKHMLIHTGEKPFKCVVCNKAFTRSTLLYRHEKVHTDQPKFLCVFCEKPFLSTDELEKHTERHRKNRPFSCKICGKRFAFKQGLERHETIHAKEQPYKCEYCDLSFSTPSKLARHLTAHAGDRPFPCKLCPKSYLLSHHLTRHLRSHTQGSGSYKCYDCEKTFTTRDDLIYHSAVHATQTLVCPLCKEHFSDLDHVTEHIKEHAEGEQYACEFCDLIFMTPEKLQSHSDAQHSEDLAAYKEHASKQNIKRESTMLYDENSQEMNEGEVIQEFIIEEYHQDDQDEILDSRITHTLVKQEAEQNRNESTSAKRLSRGSSTEQSEVFPSKETEEEDYDMEIETLERDDDEEYMYSNSEPPKKYRKVTQVEPRKDDEDKSKRILNTRKSEEKKPKMKQLAINTVLQQLPKGVTIIKKDKSPKEKRVEVKEISILNKSTQAVKADHTTPSNKTGKIINTRPKSLEKPPQVEIIKRKRTGSPSTSPSTPTILNKTNNSEQTKTSPNQQPKKLVEMMIGDRKVKVQKIMMTKAEVAAMAKEGKIEMKGGTMILKQEKASPKATPKK